jgi:hypothetical protein
MSDQSPNIDDMNTRSREVFRRVVEGYLESGAPVGSGSVRHWCVGCQEDPEIPGPA